MYVAVKGGERAILNSHKLVAEERRGDPALAELDVRQIVEQFRLAVDRVMTEGSVYDPELAALALKQAQGDAVEAIFLLRAYRTTLPRFAVSRPIETRRMAVRRRVSAAYKDVPGGQVLGPTYDYTHRLLDFALAAEGGVGAPEADLAEETLPDAMPPVLDILDGENLIEREFADREGESVFDLTRESLSFPAGRDQRLQNLARGDEGFVLGLAYSTTRGYGGSHPFVGEVRLGETAVEITPEELGFSIEIGDITVTECQMINQFKGTAEKPAQFTRGYGLSFGHGERKAMSMALVDRAMRCRELGEDALYPAQDEEFVLSHSDNIEAVGFVTHFKLPHYVDFQAELELVRRLRAEHATRVGRDGELREAAE
ncbi:MAG: carbon-phosphorus lyase complex subunit PhnI [Rhizobiales bacterium 65-9]|nr:carbon-phosphorus lyase complex subunit PhnI [Hyphomicrobiales bacterium]OJY40164.1 MAG: carbon-phosphorus lyase complex subunit PhnI [Rhizobiales bacterium 65-9]